MLALFAAVALASFTSAPPVPSPAEAVDEAKLVEVLKALPTKRSAFGNDEERAGLEQAEKLLTDRAERMGYSVMPDPFTWKRRGEKTEQTWRNLVFEKPGVGPLAKEVLIVGAHFDAVPGSPGADDNGTGTAALMEIARVLKDREHQRTVRFVLFNLEEVNLNGARAHAKRVRVEEREKGLRFVGMLSLEMLGYYSDQPGSQKNPFKDVPGAPQATVGDFVALCASSVDQHLTAALDAAMKAAEPGVKTLRVDQFPNERIAIIPPDLMRSDHAPFILIGVPAVMITDTSNFRNPHYHTPGDTVETLNIPMFVRTTRALAGAVDALLGPAGSEAPPLRREFPAQAEPEKAGDQPAEKKSGADAVAPAPPSEPK